MPVVLMQSVRRSAARARVLACLEKSCRPTKWVNHSWLPQRNDRCTPAKQDAPAAVARSMSLLKHSEQHRQFLTDDRQHINKARKEAEALFRSEPRLVESLPADPPPTEASVRKPRILSASPLPVTRSTAEAPISSKPQPKPPVSVSQMAHAHRELLKARAPRFSNSRMSFKKG